MDVVLDANAYLADPKMEGPGLRSLFDYLRMTESRLLIPRVVLDEVLARYPERIRAQWRRAKNEVAGLRNIIVRTKIRTVPIINQERETRALKRRLLNPVKHVKSIVLSNFAAVSVEEIARRGIERIPPANGAGEELRDVIVWLMILAHARKSGAEIAFITKDEHFMRENALHPALSEDVQKGGALLHFHASIEDFLKTHLAAPRDLTAQQALALYSEAHVLDRFEIEARKYIPRQMPADYEVLDRQVTFASGAIYDVGADSQYGEIAFRGELTIRGTTVGELRPMSQVVAPYPFQSGESYAVTYTYSPSSRTFENYATVAPPNSLLLGTTSAVPVNYSVTFDPTVPPRSNVYKISGVVTVSIRVVSGKVTQVETEKFQLEGVLHVRP